jgi:L-arabonate dehydrase
MVRENLTIDKILTRDAFLNAIRTLAAVGGSTNAVVHLLATAGRLGVKLELEVRLHPLQRSYVVVAVTVFLFQDFDKYGSHIPLMVNLLPSGKYLMEDFFYAGGLPVVLKQLIEAGEFHPEALTVNGKPIGVNNSDAECYKREVISSYSEPVQEKAGIAVLKVGLRQMSVLFGFCCFALDCALRIPFLSVDVFRAICLPMAA